MARLLLVENSQFMLARLRAIVEGRHEVVAAARNADEAVELYRTHNPDVVTMDIVMPRVNGRNGLDAIRDIMAIDPRAVILVITANDAVTDEALAAGAKTFVLKPLDDADVLRRIDHCLASRAA